MRSIVLKNEYKFIREKEVGSRRKFRRLCVLFGAIFCLAAIWKLGIRSHAMEEVSSELVILIDDSKSVEPYKDAIKDWATDIGAYLQDTNISIHLISFGEGIQNEFDGRIDKGRSETEGEEEESILQQYVAKLREMKFAEMYTDQAYAFAHAVEMLEGSSAENKCIVMLSDAKLDYRDDSKECSGKKQFIKDVKKFARGNGQRVILVGFGDSTEMFDACMQDHEQGLAVTILTEKNQPKDLFKDVLQNTLEDIGIDIVSPRVQRQDNQMIFSVGENCYRMILEIDAPMDHVDEKMWNSIAVTGNGSVRKRDGRSILGRKCYLYFAEPEEGEYMVTMPDQGWEGRVIEQRKVEVLEIGLKVNGREGKELSVQGGKFELAVKVGTQDSGQTSDLTGLRVSYCIVPEEEWEMDLEAEDSDYQVRYTRTSQSLDQEGELTQMITLGNLTEDGDSHASQDPNGMYICQVIVEQGQKILCRSEAIQIRVEKQFTKRIRIGQGIEIFSEFAVPEGKEDGKIKIGDEVVFGLEDENDYGSYKYGGGVLTFLKAGKYETSIVGDGYEGNVICYEVVTILGEVFGRIQDYLSEVK